MATKRKDNVKLAGHLHKKFGRNILARREALELSQTGLADMVGCNRVNVSNIERGTQGCTLVMLVSLCKALKCTPDALLKGSC